ncbi:leucine-rich repeat-containing protein 45-like [Mya arenaria]|uniref:leucine-rich repeat-containing protein 45-like n=1 Tax=Mya arenaria TaxID=6604 RepID=UPI0022DEF56E|nr:leucine-rich repeat-containing protein 45-like [Mya arenaria]XP_052762884.1 leucine-rich repeat-containing protein 45-like [Mya arenaria]XP_052762891.1 leucine-rich repeat-containing protein 45-like [Mya arenaria]XP_052762901.1 leucine-rich repeat-containing protein 45-like [Mya arenaria]XP_052762906.1 leucine-rich repeat-containing protein 45-like [Mya arenaria]XP_052762914.1 leucine-rich repeat-containing protein 45-like [Mya arenaria]XP_052762921.1 leucine-rich repeat-containing protein
MVEEFKHSFLRLCREHGLEAQDCVVNLLKSLEHSSKKEKLVLNLSTNSLTSKTCAVLGKIVAADHTFVEYKFADCMLSEDAVKGLAYGFSRNSYVRKLDLKGNNIRGSAAEALGKMLRHNKSILSLCLEWNALGMLDNAFTIFCEGVGANSKLQALDLRNNQISHDSAAELCRALKQNSSIRALDLRWNNVGLLGGRAIVEMLQTNKIITRIELAGNNIPADILKAIETALSQNQDRELITDDHQKKTSMLTKHIHHIEKERATQMDELMGTIDQQEELLRKGKRSSNDKISQLQVALGERKAAFNSLASKLAMTESELALVEQKCNDYSVIITRLKQELSESSSVHQSDIRREREDRGNTEMKLLKELSEANERNISFETKVEDLERKTRQQTEQIFGYKEQITSLQAEIKMKGSQFEERLQSERSRNKDGLHEAELIRQKEVSRLKTEFEETEKALRERINRLEMSRLQLEEEISQLKTAAVTDKLHAEENISIAKQKVKLEEENRVKALEEKLRVLSVSRDDLQAHHNQHNTSIKELTSKNSSLTLEVESYKRRIEELSEEVNNKNMHTMQEVGKVRIELQSVHTKLDNEKAIQRELRDRLTEADNKLSEQMMKHRDLLESKEREITHLQEKLRAREAELSRSREEEMQRAQILQSAVMNYVSKVPSSPR